MIGESRILKLKMSNITGLFKIQRSVSAEEMTYFLIAFVQIPYFSEIFQILLFIGGKEYKCSVIRHTKLNLEEKQLI